MTADESSFTFSFLLTLPAPQHRLILFFLFSSVVIGSLAGIYVSREGYANVLEEREIKSGGQLIRIFASPNLAEGQHRLVLSWQTTEDLDIYALGRNM